MQTTQTQSERGSRYLLTAPVNLGFKRRVFAEAARQGTNVAALMRRLLQDELLRAEHDSHARAQARYVQVVSEQLRLMQSEQASAEQEAIKREFFCS